MRPAAFHSLRVFRCVRQSRRLWIWIRSSRGERSRLSDCSICATPASRPLVHTFVARNSLSVMASAPARSPTADSAAPYIGDEPTTRPPLSTSPFSTSLSGARSDSELPTSNTRHVPNPTTGIDSPLEGIRRLNKGDAPPAPDGRAATAAVIRPSTFRRVSRGPDSSPCPLLISRTYHDLSPTFHEPRAQAVSARATAHRTHSKKSTPWLTKPTESGGAVMVTTRRRASRAGVAGGLPRRRGVVGPPRPARSAKRCESGEWVTQPRRRGSSPATGPPASRGHQRSEQAPLPLEPVLLQLAPERRPPDPECFGRARVIAPEALDGLEDVHALGLGERRLPRQLRRGPELQPGRDVGRQVLGLDAVAPGQDGRALDRVLELAHVAR